MVVQVVQVVQGTALVLEELVVQAVTVVLKVIQISVMAVAEVGLDLGVAVAEVVLEDQAMPEMPEFQEQEEQEVGVLLAVLDLLDLLDLLEHQQQELLPQGSSWVQAVPEEVAVLEEVEVQDIKPPTAEPEAQVQQAEEVVPEEE